eukprot:TRINITY_DN18082_c0_g2_i1.p1 TRINITY_DN18082_c0_g2~~TRINITY_DN18082_c0_g2_i1.p1  ORF type:complete len:844 (-),score=111.38 TRINITY_DN18082_c0_g2_i1:160-2691(-)
MPGQIITKMMLDIFKKDFDGMDTNGNGCLDLSEVRTLVERHSGVGRATDQEVQKFLSEFDSDHDGVISFQEYLNVVLGDGWSIEGHVGDWWNSNGVSAKDGAGDVSTSILHRPHNGRRQAISDKDQEKYLQSVKTLVKDARSPGQPPSVHGMGFAIRRHVSGMSKDQFYDDAVVTSQYYANCEEVVKAETGASMVHCFHHQLHKGVPAKCVAHCDYSVKSAFELPQVDKSFAGRLSVISVWRHIDPSTTVQNHHLAMLDASTLVCPDDFVFFNDPKPGGVTETFHLDPHNSMHHRWYYFSHQSADEAIILTQLDSDPDSRARYTFHSMIAVNNEQKHFVPEYLEVRCLAYFPQERDTMPWAPMPPHVRDFAVADQVRNDFRYLSEWDAGGKQWVTTEASKGNLHGMIHGSISHHVREGKREAFRGLDDEGIARGASKILEDDFIPFMIKTKLGVSVPGVDLKDCDKGDPRGDIVATVNYRDHNGARQSEQDSQGHQHIRGIPSFVRDARMLPTPPTVETLGFALRHQPTGMSREDFYDDEKVRSRYYKLCEEVIKIETGALGVKCFHHAVRGRGRMPFAGIAHSDYSVKTAFGLVAGVVPDNVDLKTFKGRICVMNVWRNIDPDSNLLNHHLAMCDGSTCVGPDDYVYYDVTDPTTGQTSETFHMSPHHRRRHGWYYYPQMTADEALIFMQYDSDPRRRCRYTTHTSLTVNDMFTNYPRESIEVRLVAFFPQDFDTMPDMTMPEHLRIPAAVEVVRHNFAHLDHWDAGGQSYVKGEAAKGNLEGLVRGHCHHFRQEGKRGEFKDLTDEDVEKVVKEVLKDDHIKQSIEKHLKVKVRAKKVARK